MVSDSAHCLMSLSQMWLNEGHLLGAKHAAERLQRCWVHPLGQAFSIKHLRKSFKVGCIPLSSYQMSAVTSSQENPAHIGGDSGMLIVITRTTYLVRILTECFPISFP